MMKQLMISIAAFLLAGSACSKSNDLFCDGQTACDSESKTSYCQVSENTCVARPTDESCNSVEVCTTTELPFCSDAFDGVCLECIEHSQCPGDSLCDTSTNSCVDFSCNPGPTGDALCNEVATGLPYCVSDDVCGACLESLDCTDELTPVCDEESFACRGCTQNDECDSNVCDVEAGSCVQESAILHVSKQGTLAINCGDPSLPCLTIQSAVDIASSTRNHILIEPGTYSDELLIDTGTIRLIANGNVVLDSDISEAGPILVVSGDADVKVTGIRFADPIAPFIDATLDCIGPGASLHLDLVQMENLGCSGVRSNCDLQVTNSTFIGNDCDGIHLSGGSLRMSNTTISGTDVGVFSSNTSARIESSTFIGNDFGINFRSGTIELYSSTISNNAKRGLRILDAGFVIVNNFIVQNNLEATLDGVTIDNGTTQSPQQFDFNTVADNREQNLNCSTFSAMTGVGNIITTESTPNSLAGCSFSNSNISGQSGNGNINVSPLFINPVSGDGGDYHLQSASLCVDTISQAVTTIDVDFDGDFRPGNGFLDMGADEAN